jgi:hypothetical protein
MKIKLHIHTLMLTSTGETIIRRFKHIPTSTRMSKTMVEDSDGEVRFMSNENYKYISEKEFAKIK